MIVQDISGKTYAWKLTGHLATKKDYQDRPRSALHCTARQLLIELFPTLQILEEVPVRVMPEIILYLDFYLPLTKTAVEVHGQQHYAFNSKFHHNNWDFIRQTKNDGFKQQWCKLNNIDIIVLPHNETKDEWKRRLSSTEDGTCN